MDKYYMSEEAFNLLAESKEQHDKERAIRAIENTIDDYQKLVDKLDSPRMAKAIYIAIMEDLFE